MRFGNQKPWVLALAIVAVPLAAEAQYTFIDLNSGFTGSYGYGISGGQQVGSGDTVGNYHALLWSGTAASAVDLQSFLSSNYTASSATAIDANGDIVGYAYNNSTGQDDAILWVPVDVPEPGTWALCAIGLAVPLITRRRRGGDSSSSHGSV